MPQNTDYVAVVRQTVATSKEIAVELQDLIADGQVSQMDKVTLSLVQLQAIASQLRITANLVDGLLTENETMLTRIQELVDRVHK